MRKKAYVLLVFSVVSLIFIACSYKNEGKMNKLVNEILADGKTVELVTSYDNSDHITYYWITIYNDDKKEKIYCYNRQMKLESYTTYEYDDHGNIIKEYEYSVQDKLLSTRYNKYDEHNRLTEYSDRSEGTQEIFYTTVCEYDMNDNLIKTKEYKEPIEESNLYGYSEYKYEENQLITVTDYLYISEDKKEVLQSYYKNEYDKEGKLYKRCYYNKKCEITNYVIFEYK